MVWILLSADFQCNFEEKWQIAWGQNQQAIAFNGWAGRFLPLGVKQSPKISSSHPHAQTSLEN
jgi:hypothetical protein